MRLSKFFTLIAALATALTSMGAETFSLDSCRTLALANNKQLMMARQKIRTATYQQKEAFAAYLPAIDFAGGYMYNQKKLSVFGSDQYLPVGTFNEAALTDPKAPKYNYDVVKNPETGKPIVVNGEPIPAQTALIPKESMEFDIHNVFFRLPDVRRAAQAYDGINIKLMKSTGLHEAHQMAELARALGMKVMLGCMTETSCAVTAAAQLSPLVDWADLDGNLLIANDIFDGIKINDGRVIIPENRPGIGVELIG